MKAINLTGSSGKTRTYESYTAAANLLAGRNRDTKLIASIKKKLSRACNAGGGTVGKVRVEFAS